MIPGEATLRLSPEGSRLVAELSGELDLASVPLVERGLRDALTAGPREVVIDLAGVSFLDSTATALLFRLASESAARRRHFVLVAPPDGAARRLLDLVGFEQAATVVDARP